MTLQPTVLRLVVDRTNPIPLYFQVATRLEELIESGAITAGSRLENEVDLAEQIGVSRPTMRRAMQYLVDRGMLIRRRGLGTEVVHPKVRRPVELSSLHDDLTKGGRAPRTEILGFEVVPAPDVVAQAIGVPDGTEVYSIERLRFADDEPLAIMHNCVPVDLLPLREDDLRQYGLYQLLRAHGRTPRLANQVIGARAASSAEARALGERRNAPLLTMTRTAYDGHGHPVEYGCHVYRASKYSFELVLTTS